MKYFEFRDSQTLEALLRQRNVPPPSANLTTRIMERTLRVGKPSAAVNIMPWLQELLADAMPLQPAYVFAAVLLIGFTFGFAVLPVLTTSDQASSAQINLADDGDMP